MTKEKHVHAALIVQWAKMIEMGWPADNTVEIETHEIAESINKALEAAK